MISFFLANSRQDLGSYNPIASFVRPLLEETKDHFLSGDIVFNAKGVGGFLGLQGLSLLCSCEDFLVHQDSTDLAVI